jgi:hypothetical protein
MAYRHGTCKNCWESIEQFVSTALDSKETWVHVYSGRPDCTPTYAEPAD